MASLPPSSGPPSYYPSSHPSSNPSFAPLQYDPPQYAVDNFEYTLYGTLGSMVFLLFVVIFFQFVGGKLGEHLRYIKHICQHGAWFNQRNSLSQRIRGRNANQTLVDDHGRILRDSREDDDGNHESGDFESDGYSMNLRNDYASDANRWGSSNMRELRI